MAIVLGLNDDTMIIGEGEKKAEKQRTVSVE